MLLEAVYAKGIYFDRAIDLIFYNDNMKPLYYLKTPKTGYKPEIIIKGTLIENSYAVDSYIAITNLSYDVNIEEVSYIKATMYYRGMQGSTTITGLKTNKHSILYSVIYADQDKQPPNRMIRFQCTVAAKDYTRLSPDMVLDSDADTKETSRTLSEELQEVAKHYNNSLIGNLKKDDTDMSIKYIHYTNSEHKGVPVNVKLKGSINHIIRELNCFSTTIGEKSFNLWNISIRQNCIWVNGITPDEEIDSPLFKYAPLNESIVEQNATEYFTDNRPVKMNFTKGAYRNGNIINLNTIFDDRIYPGCVCSISGDAIMGKKSTSNTIRFTSLKGTEVQFRPTGKIDFMFSTTDDSNMSLSGPILKVEKL